MTNRSLKKSGFLRGPLFLLSFLLFLTSCTSYLKVYRSLETDQDKRYFHILLYWVKSERLEQFFKMDNLNKVRLIEQEIKEIAERMNMPPAAFKNRQLERVRLANMRYGSVKRGMFTDQGRIFIKYGEPEKIIEEDDSVYGKIETWTYPAYDINFTFQVDEERHENRLLNLSDDRL